MKRRQFCALLLATALLTPLSTLAENSTTAGGFTIHHNAFPTSTLTPEVAKAYGIQRSNVRGMLNVSVIKEKEGTTGTSVPARVEVKTLNLTGQTSHLPMREIKEQDAVYYVGETPVANRETLIFDITVTPQGAGQPSEVRFKREFYTD